MAIKKISHHTTTTEAHPKTVKDTFRNSRSPQKITVSLRIDPQLWKQVKRWALDKDTTISATAEAALELMMEQEGKS